jgi:Ca2+-transporting ATPase
MRKMMSTVHKADGSYIQYTKGAPDEIIKICSMAELGGEVFPLTEEIKQTIFDENKRMADRALRVLAVAYKPLEDIPSSFEPEALENNMIFTGLTGMIDPVRPEVKAAIEECRSAGNRPIMITGDHKRYRHRNCP